MAKNVDSRAFRNWPDIYNYYSHKGLSVYVMDNLVDLAIALLVAFAPVFISSIEYERLPNARGLGEIFLSFSEGWSRTNLFGKTCVIVFLCFCAVKLLDFARNLPKFISLRKYFEKTLGIGDNELPGFRWASVAESISVIDSDMETPKLSIAQLILKWDNYICAIVSDETLLMWKFPPNSSQVSPIPTSNRFFPILKFAITGILIDSNGSSIVSGEQASSAQLVERKLKFKFRVIGAALLLFSPLVFAFELMHLFYYYFRSLRRCESEFSFRDWSPATKWIIREYNELPHVFKQRMAESYKWTNGYLAISQTPVIRPLARFVMFLTELLLAVIGVLAFVTDVQVTLATVMWFGKSVAWFAVLLMGVYYVAKSLASGPLLNVTADVAVAEIEKCLQCEIRDESHSVHSVHTRDKIRRMFPNIFWNIGREILSVLANPFLFLVFLPERAASMVEFIRKNSAERGTLGWICAFSTFEVGERGFSGTPDQREKVMRSLRDFERQGARDPVIPGCHHVESIEFGDIPIDNSHVDLFPRRSSALMRTDFEGSNDALDLLG